MYAFHTEIRFSLHQVLFFSAVCTIFIKNYKLFLLPLHSDHFKSVCYLSPLYCRPRAIFRIFQSQKEANPHWFCDYKGQSSNFIV